MTGVQTCALPICFPVTISRFKYKTVTEFDAIGNRKKVRRLKTAEELKDMTSVAYRMEIMAEDLDEAPGAL